MPLFKSSAQKERERHNREMIDHAHNAPLGGGIQHPQSYTGGQDDLYDKSSVPATSGPGGFAGRSQQPPTQTGYGPTGVGQDTWDPAHTEGHHAQGIPPTSTINHGSGHSSGTGTGRLTGKVEAAVGSAVGSQSLKAKGEQKQYEAEAYKLQAAELSEAERLEGEARLRRERAVAHGAHPGNLNPQGQNPQGQNLAGAGGKGQAAW